MQIHRRKGLLQLLLNSKIILIGTAIVLSIVTQGLTQFAFPSLPFSRRADTNSFLPALQVPSKDSLKSDVLNPGNYVPEVGLISDDPNLIQFLLYSSSGNEYEVLELGNVNSILSSEYNPENPVKFLVHGFQNNFKSEFPQNVKDAYLSRNLDYNVIIVDWGPLAIPNAPYVAPVFYPFAVKNVWRTGERIGQFITWLKDEDLIELDLVHIIGFSLGSHVAGKAASAVQDNLQQSIARVTALDPAGPVFYTGILARTLRASDAAFVDVIHTNAGQLGIWANIGSVDYYVNGGSGPQPGCVGYSSVDSVLRSVTGTILGSCSHLMATKFYAKTILDSSTRSSDSRVCSCRSLKRYTLNNCNNCATTVTFGEFSSPRTTGKHYITFSL